ncbi:MAG: repeat-containing protein, partial [Pedosphaera sp.]|nr:repeat-containing protein [Pedosphaera sp.]
AALTLQSNIAFNISGAAAKTLAQNAVINSTGNGTWTGTGNVNAGQNSVLNNTGSFVVQNDAQFINITGGSPAPLFANNGTFIKAGSVNPTTFSSASGGVAFNNNGTINIQSGDLVLGGGGTGTNGTDTAAANLRIDLIAGNFTWFGNLLVNGAGTTRVSGANVALGGGLSTVTGTFEIAAGTVSGASTFAGPGTFNWTGGSIAATFNLQANMVCNISIAGDKTLASSGIINNAGTLNWSGTGNINMGAASAINNSGTFIAQNDMQFYNNTGGFPAPVVNNTGTFRKTGSTGQTVFAVNNGGVNFTNTGTVDLQSGTLVVNAGYGTAPSARLNIALGGLNPNTQFGTETFAGLATFNGTLSIALTNGFAPTNGQSFAIVNFGSATGQFATTQFPPLPKELRWQLNYNSNSLVARVVPATIIGGLLRTAGGDFQIAITGETGSACVVETSTNLVNWAGLTTNAPFNGTFNFTDTTAGPFPRRFYRITILP